MNISSIPFGPSGPVEPRTEVGSLHNGFVDPALQHVDTGLSKLCGQPTKQLGAEFVVESGQLHAGILGPVIPVPPGVPGGE